MQILWFKCDEIIPGVALAVLVLSICLGGHFFYLDVKDSPDFERHCRMAAEGESQADRYREENHSAFVLGYTGEIGRVLVKDLAKAKIFKKVILIGRREVELDSDLGPEFEQKIVDFNKLDDYANNFKDLDVGFCCLGTTKGKSGVEGFIRVDYDYVLKSAEIAKANGCKHFNLVSSQGADKNSSFLYTRTKGQVEEGLKVIHFDRVSVFRPGVLLVNREESRPAEAFVRAILKPVSYLFPTAITTPGDVLSRAMINNAVAKSDRTQELYENKAIHQLSWISKVCGTTNSNNRVGQESSKRK